MGFVEFNATIFWVQAFLALHLGTFSGSKFKYCAIWFHYTERGIPKICSIEFHWRRWGREQPLQRNAMVRAHWRGTLTRLRRTRALRSLRRRRRRRRWRKRSRRKGFLPDTNIQASSHTWRWLSTASHQKQPIKQKQFRGTTCHLPHHKSTRSLWIFFRAGGKRPGLSMCFQQVMKIVQKAADAQWEGYATFGKLCELRQVLSANPNPSFKKRPWYMP